MAGNDYYSCDKCGGKCFYDVTIYEYIEVAGEFKALCAMCAGTHTIEVVPRSNDCQMEVK